MDRWRQETIIISDLDNFPTSDCVLSYADLLRWKPRKLDPTHSARVRGDDVQFIFILVLEIGAESFLKLLLFKYSFKIHFFEKIQV